MASPAGVSDEMRALFEGQKRLHEATLRLQKQIEEEEAAYLEETVHGNIVRGWDGFIDSKPNRREANPKKLKPYTEAEHLFSSCCSYAELGGEPTFDLVDYNNTREETVGRRRLTVTLSGGVKISSEIATGGAGHSGSSSSSTSHGHATSGGGGGLHHVGGGKGSGSKLSSMKTGVGRGGHHSSKGGASAAPSFLTSAAAASSHKTGKLHKKRKREKLDGPPSHVSSRAHSDASAAVSTEEDGGGTASSTSTPLRSRAGSVEDSIGGDDIMDVF